MRTVLFGLGFTGVRIAATIDRAGGDVTAIGCQTPAEITAAALAGATAVISTVPPDGGGSDPVLAAYGAAIARVPWIGYVSSTGVYGDSGGAWVDEGAPLRGRRGGRIAAEAAWLALDACALRVPGIYGPGRSVIERVRAGSAHRVDLPQQVFSRIHVDDLVAGLLAAMAHGARGPFNLADDLPAAQNALIEWTCTALALPLPPLVAPDDPALSAAARAFYGENRRVASGRARRRLNWAPRYPDYRAGLRALIATTSPPITSRQPASAAADQR